MSTVSRLSACLAISLLAVCDHRAWPQTISTVKLPFRFRPREPPTLSPARWLLLAVVAAGIRATLFALFIMSTPKGMD
jgi:hypothetical protein